MNTTPNLNVEVFHDHTDGFIAVDVTLGKQRLALTRDEAVQLAKELSEAVEIIDVITSTHGVPYVVV